MEGKRGKSKDNVSEKLAAAKGKRIELVWDSEIGAAEHPNGTHVINAIGVWQRAEFPMLYDKYSDAPDTFFQELLTHLSVSSMLYNLNCNYIINFILYVYACVFYVQVCYEINEEDPRIMKWLKAKLKDHYKNWKSKCYTEFRNNGKDPPYPIEFQYRPNQWEWLMNHFETPAFLVTF